MFRLILKPILIFKLTLLARLVLWKYKPKIVAVTGSVGKTSTKDAICLIAQSHVYARCSEKSFNSEIGIPLTVLGAKNPWGSFSGWMRVFAEGCMLLFFKNHYPDWLVVEVGTDRPGDIASVAKWLKPHVAVFTVFPKLPVHVEFFKTREALIEEKSNLAKYLAKDGTLILNADDLDVLALKNKFERKTVTYGVSGANISARDGGIIYDEAGKPKGVGATIDLGGNTAPLEIMGTLGTHYILIGAAGIAASIPMGISVQDAIKDLANYKVPPGRLRILKGMNGSIILDDTYNSSPAALEAGLRSFHNLKNAKRRIVVLGDMLELGAQSSDAHREIGAFASRIADVLITVGPRARLMSEQALDEGMKAENVLMFERAEQAGEYLQENIMEGDAVYFKASQGIRLEKAVKIVLAEPEKAKELLVRQEKEWEKK